MAEDIKQISVEEAIALTRQRNVPAPAATETGLRTPTSSQEVISALPPGQGVQAPPPSRPQEVVPEGGMLISQDPYTLDASTNLPTASPDWYEDPVMAARAFLDGQLFGFSDKIGAGLAATAAYISQPAPVDPNTGEEIKGGLNQYLAIYRDMMNHLQDERNIYTANNPKASLALNLSGAVMSPLGKPLAWLGQKVLTTGGSVVGTAGDRLSRLVGRPELTRAQRSLGRMEATAAPTIAAGQQTRATATQQLTQRALPQMGRLERFARNTGAAVPAGAIGGGLFATGVAQPGTDLGAQAMEGAAMGALLSPVAAFIPVARDFMTSRRVAQSLGEGGNFVPLTLAAGPSNPVLAWIYQKLVSRAFVGAGTMDNQASRWYTPVFDKVERLEQSLKSMKEVFSALSARVTQRVKNEADALEDLIKQTSRANRREIKTDFRNKIDRMRQDAATAEGATTLVPQLFRSQALQSAIPDSFPASVKKEILDLAEIGEYFRANELFRKAWNEHGFDMLNTGVFKIGQVVETTTKGQSPLFGGAAPTTTTKTVNINPLLDRLENALDVEDLAQLTVPGNKLEFVRTEVENFLRGLMDKNGNIKGTSLATLRNMISGMVGPQRMAGQQTAADAQLKAVWLELKSILDDVVQTQLTPDQLTAFKQHQSAYRNRLAVDSSITSSYKRGGAFEPDDWLNAVGKLFRKDVGVGRAPLQGEARNASAAITNAENTLVASSKEAQLLLSQQQVIEMNNRAVAIEREMARAQAEIARVQRSVPNVVTRELNKAERTGAAPGSARIASLEEQLRTLQDQRTQLLSILPRKGNVDAITAGEGWLATRLINPVMGAAGGLLTASGLTFQSVQRTLAGQTAWQEYSNRIARQMNLSQSVQSVGGGEPSVERSARSQVVSAETGKRAKMFEALLASGNAEKFKRSQPDVYKMMEDAHKKVYK